MNRWFHIILTSFNRPTLVRHSLEALVNQTDNRWTCYVMDDGSEEETRRVIQEYAQQYGNIEAHWYKATEAEREQARYSVKINDILPGLATGVVGYLCDNTLWKPDLIKTVLEWFEADPHRWSGYVKIARYHWKRGQPVLERDPVTAYPSVIPETNLPVSHPDYVLDHSQVFHRLPVAIRWPEEAATKSHGDGVFFSRLVAEYGPIQPIEPLRVLAAEYWPE
jgi:glycosyltransferase involved in cell wall biosynthesis